MGEVQKTGRFRLGGAPGVGLGILLAVLGMLVLDQLRVKGWWDGSSTAPNDAEALSELRDALAMQVEVHSELADRIAELDERVSQLQLQQDYAIGMHPQQGDSTPDEANPDEAEGSSGSEEGEDDDPSGFDDTALLAQGIHPSEIERLHEIWERHELERAEITNRALREGTFFKEPHRAELARLDRELRESLSDEDYDRYLYARGEPNRIRAREVLNGSSASRAGLLPGDVIVRYDDERVFGPGDLLRASSLGTLGERVPITIERPGFGRRTLYIERGPLGILMQHKTAPPIQD